MLQVDVLSAGPLARQVRACGRMSDNSVVVCSEGLCEHARKFHLVDR